VVVAGIGWRGDDARSVLHLLAVRGFTSWRTPAVTAEWTEVTARVAAEERRWRNPNWPAWLDWLLRASRLREDLPVAQIVKRDPKDDPIVSAAIACRCAFLVSYDPHLLRLEKPYGVQCVTPRSFLSIVLRES
jgi:predicted nucleic acid-binding protein